MRRFLSLSCIVALALVIPSSGHASRPAVTGSALEGWTSVSSKPVAEVPARIRLYEAIAQKRPAQEIVALQREVLASPRSEGGSELTAVADEVDADENYVISTADLDGDGLDDVLLFQYHQGLTYVTGRSGIDGGELWTIPANYPLIAVRDFNGDGTTDVLMLTFEWAGGTPLLSSSIDQIITVYDGASGSVLYSTTYTENYRAVPGVGRDDGFLYAVYFSEDADGDDVGDLQFNTVDYSFVSAGVVYYDRATITAHLVSGASGEAISDLSASGPYLEACALACVASGGFPDAVPLGDVDDDGLSDVALTSNTLRSQGMDARAADGSETYWHRELKSAPAFMIPLQLDGDGASDVLLIQYPKVSLQLVELIMINGDSGATLWSVPPKPEPWWFFGDVDGDGGEDFQLLQFTDDGVDFAAQSGATGELIWSIPIEAPDAPPGGFSEAWVCLCPSDVTGDGANDDFIAAFVYDESFTLVDSTMTVVSGVDGSVVWTESFDDGNLPHPLGGDVTGDGSEDMVSRAWGPLTTTFSFINGSDGAEAGSFVHTASGSEHDEWLYGADIATGGADEIILNGFAGSCDEFGCTWSVNVVAYQPDGTELWSL